MIKRSHIFLAAALLIAWAAAFPLLEPNALLNTRGGGDSPFLLQRLHQLIAGLQGGQFPVRWMPNAAYGLGYPFFHFYAPFSIYVAALFKGVGFPFTRAIQLAQLSGFLVAGWGMFALARTWFKDDWAAMLASVAYTTAPFHFVNVYVRGDSLAEFWAMAFYPVTLLAATKVGRANDWREARLPFLGLAFSFAALVLSHNISALIFSPFLAIYCLQCGAGSAISRGLKYAQQRIVWLVGAGLVGLLLSAWFWLPAIVEKELVQLGPVTEGYFSYVNHFRGWDLVQPTLIFDYAVTANADPFRLGLVQAVLTGVGVIGLLWRWRTGQRREISFVLLLLVMASWMITPLSRIAWEGLPLLDFTQFPWRFLSVQAVGTALAIGGLGLFGKEGLVKQLGMAGIVVLMAWSALSDLRQVDFLALHDSDVTAARLAEYEWFTSNIGTTISAEYLPQTVQPRPYAGFEARGFFASGDGTIERMEDGVWRVTGVSAENHIHLPHLAIDGIRVRVNGERSAWASQNGTGWLRLTVPAGENIVSVDYVGTRLTRSAEFLSLLTLILVLISFINRRNLVVTGAVTLLFTGLVLIARDGSVQASRAPSWDFAQQAYLHGSPDGILFSNGARLGDYTISHTENGLTVTLDWLSGSGTATIALATPAINRATPTIPVPILAEQSQPIALGPVAYQFALDENLPAGRYLLRLTLADGVALTEDGQPRGDLFLAPIEIERPAEIADVAQLTARVDEIERLENGNILLKTAWATPQRLAANYQMTWRVYDRFGRFYAELDAQPAYGFSPTTLWQPNIWQHDWLALNWLAEDGVEPYSVVATMRDVPSGDFVYQRELGTFVIRNGQPVYSARQPQQELPATAIATATTFGNQIELAGYEIEETTDLFLVTLYWRRISPLSEPLDDYLRFLYLVNPITGEILQQMNTPPRFGIAPTSGWHTGEIITDLVALPRPTAPSLDIQVGLFQIINDSYPRLPITSAGVAQEDLLLLTQCEKRPCDTAK